MTITKILNVRASQTVADDVRQSVFSYPTILSERRIAHCNLLCVQVF